MRLPSAGLAMVARRTPPSWRTWSLRVAPYAVTGVVVAAILLHRYPAAEIVHEMAAGHALGALPLGFAMPFVVWLPYAVCDRIVLEGAIGPVALRDIVRAKAASAVLFILGYFRGAAGTPCGSAGRRAWELPGLPARSST